MCIFLLSMNVAEWDNFRGSHNYLVIKYACVYNMKFS